MLFDEPFDFVENAASLSGQKRVHATTHQVEGCVSASVRRLRGSLVNCVPKVPS